MSHDLDWYVCNLRGLNQNETYGGIECLKTAYMDVESGHTVPNVTEIAYRDLILRFRRDDEIVKAILRGGRHRFQNAALQDDLNPAVEIEYIELSWLNQDGEKFRKFGPVAVSMWDYKSHWVNGEFIMDQSSMVKEQFLNYDGREIFHETVSEWKRKTKVKTDHFSFTYMTDSIHKMMFSADLLRSQDTIR